jgi:hypothetical protein
MIRLCHVQALLNLIYLRMLVDIPTSLYIMHGYMMLINQRNIVKVRKTRVELGRN